MSRAVAADAGLVDGDDLVCRLRAYATSEYRPAYQPPICHEAAEEIARLRARLERVVAYAETVSDWQDDSRFADGGRLAAREVLRLARGEE